MKVILNITYNGQSGNYPVKLEDNVHDETIRRIAEEAVRAGEVAGIRARNVPSGAFDHFVIDRFRAGRGRETRYVVRPKVPFGAG